MESYTNQSTDFSVDIFTNDKEFVEISYKVKFYQDSLDKITADSTIFDFHYLENGERAIYKYEHDFPEEITLFTATQEQFIISDKLEEYSTSKFVRKNPHQMSEHLNLLLMSYLYQMKRQVLKISIVSKI